MIEAMARTDGATARNRRVGLTIMRRRQQLGMTQAELAARIGKSGVSISTVQKWESGMHFPGRHLGSVEQVLGVHLGDEPESPPSISDKLRELAYEEFGADKAPQAIAYLEKLASEPDGDAAARRESGRRDQRRPESGRRDQREPA